MVVSKPALLRVAMKMNASGIPPKLAVTAAPAMTIWRRNWLRLLTTAYASRIPNTEAAMAVISDTSTLLTSDVR